MSDWHSWRRPRRSTADKPKPLLPARGCGDGDLHYMLRTPPSDVICAMRSWPIWTHLPCRVATQAPLCICMRLKEGTPSKSLTPDAHSEPESRRVVPGLLRSSCIPAFCPLRPPRNGHIHTRYNPAIHTSVCLCRITMILFLLWRIRNLL